MPNNKATTRRQTRLLLAYASREEAISHLIDSVPPDPGDVERAAARWEGAVADLVAGPPRQLSTPVIGPLPPELAERAAAVAATAQFQTLLGQNKPQFGLVAIENLISIQKMIYSDLRDLKGLDVTGTEAVFRLTVPDPVLRQIAIVQDPAAYSYTMSSENPNLRIGGMAQADVAATAPGGSQMPMHILGFFATHGGPWMQAASFQGRWFLRDGYHRAYYLLTQKVVRVPCVLLEVTSLQDLGVIRPGFVGPEVLFGDRPPLVGDFVDDHRAVSGSLIPTRKVVRIRAEEFVIPIDS